MISTLLTAVIIIILSTAVSLAHAGVGEFTSGSFQGGSNVILVALASTVAIAGAQDTSIWELVVPKQWLDQTQAFAASNRSLPSGNHCFQIQGLSLDVQATVCFWMSCALAASIAATISDRLFQMSQGTFSTGMLLGCPHISGVGYTLKQRGIAAFNIDKLTFNPFSAICIQGQSHPTWADIIYQTNRRIAALVQRQMLTFPSYLFPSKDIKVFPSSKRRVSNGN